MRANRAKGSTVVEELRDRLLRQAYLFDDPSAYSAGVEDALASVLDVLRQQPPAVVRELIPA